jgi:hypothetical protein
MRRSIATLEAWAGAPNHQLRAKGPRQDPQIGHPCLPRNATWPIQPARLPRDRKPIRRRDEAAGLWVRA